MVAGITNILTNPGLTRVAQSTSSAVSIETGLKAVGRPSFILADGKIDKKTKRYSAMKEFLYQATCLATYMLIIIPIFKNGSFKLAKKVFKDEVALQKFNSTNHYLKYRKIATMPKENRAKALEEKANKGIFSEELLSELKNDKPEIYNMAKGVIEFGNIVGSVLGLAIFAPQVSHMVVHPVLKALGMEEKKGAKQEQAH